MKVISSILIACLFLLACFAVSFSCKAAGRLIVVPDDYSTVESAMQVAVAGDTVALKKGVYEGTTNQTLVINKAISLTGEGAANTVLHLNPPLVEKNIFTVFYMDYADPLVVGCDNVKISGLTISAAGGNISVYANQATFSNNIINRGIIAAGISTQIINNSIAGGISVSGSNSNVANNTVGRGIQTKGQSNTIAGNVISGANNMYNIDVTDNSSRIFSNTILSNREWAGIHLNYGSMGNIIAKNNISSCAIDLEANCNLNLVYGNKLNRGAIGLMGFNNTFYANEMRILAIGGTHGGTQDAAFNAFYHNNFIASSPELMVFTKNLGPLYLDNGAEGNYWPSNTAQGPYQVYGSYDYFDGTIRENTQVLCGVDRYPLASAFDIDTVPLDLSYIAPLPTQTPDVTPTPSGTSNASPTQKPADTINTNQNEQGNSATPENPTPTGLINRENNQNTDTKNAPTGTNTLQISNIDSEAFLIVIVAAVLGLVVAACLFAYRKSRMAPKQLPQHSSSSLMNRVNLA